MHIRICSLTIATDHRRSHYPSIQRVASWQSTLAVASSRHPPSNASTSTRHSAISCARSADSTRSNRLADLAWAVPDRPAENGSRPTTESTRADAVVAVSSCERRHRRPVCTLCTHAHLLLTSDHGTLGIPSIAAPHSMLSFFFPPSADHHHQQLITIIIILIIIIKPSCHTCRVLRSFRVLLRSVFTSLNDNELKLECKSAFYRSARSALDCQTARKTESSRAAFTALSLSLSSFRPEFVDVGKDAGA